MITTSSRTTSHLVRTGLLGFFAVIGFDLFLHAGVLSSLYQEDSPFLLPLEEAFKLIPLGYLSFAVLIVLLEWLMVRLGINSGRAGFAFGLKLGFLIWLSLALGLASIADAPIPLLIGWTLGQALELGLAGAVIGIGLRAERLRKLALRVLLIFIVCAILAVVLQNLLQTQPI